MKLLSLALLIFAASIPSMGDTVFTETSSIHDTLATAQSLEPNDGSIDLNGLIQTVAAQGTVFFSFHATSGQVDSFSVDPVADLTASPFNLSLYDSSSNVLALGVGDVSDLDLQSIIGYVFPADGTYYVSLSYIPGNFPLGVPDGNYGLLVGPPGATTPEPASFLLLGTSLLGVAAAIRRKNSNLH